MKSSSTGARKLRVNAEKAGVLAYIMGNLYANPAKAVLREYAANARDAHREIGSDAPIEISLPSDFDATLTITDHGVGLSAADVFDTFGTYNNSTKDSSNEQVGMFGIGSKSAFSLASQFSVRSVKDGLLTYATFLIDADGDPALDILAENVPTDEHSGVSVSIPVVDASAVRDAAPGVFAYWPTGSVLIDGEPNTCVLDAAFKVDDGYYLRDGGSNRTKAIVVMDSIPYEVTERQSRVLSTSRPNSLSYGAMEVFVADLGAVMPNPSREVLSEDATTMAWMASVSAKRGERIEATLRENVARQHTMIAKARSLAKVPMYSTNKTIDSISFRRREAFILATDRNGNVSACRDDVALSTAAAWPKRTTRIVTGGTMSKFRKHAARAMNAAGWEHLFYVEDVSSDRSWLIENGKPAFEVITITDLAALDPGVPVGKTSGTGIKRTRKTPTVEALLPDEHLNLIRQTLTLEELAEVKSKHSNLLYICDSYHVMQMTHGAEPVIIVPGRGLTKAALATLDLSESPKPNTYTDANRVIKRCVETLMANTDDEARAVIYLQDKFFALQHDDADASKVTHPLLRRALIQPNAGRYTILRSNQMREHGDAMKVSVPEAVRYLDAGTPLHIIDAVMSAL